MRFRGRLLLALVAAGLVPAAVLALGIRREMDRRLTAQYERRVATLVELIRDDLAETGDRISDRLEALGSDLADDNRFRLAAVQGDPDQRAYLLDFAGGAMRAAGLSMLQVQDAAGRILSSGHFRNEYDRLEPELPRALAGESGATLVRARAPDGPFLVLARSESVRVGGRRFDLVGGIAVDRRFLARLSRGGDLSVALVWPGGRLGPDPETGAAAGPGDADERIAAELTIPYIDAFGGSTVTDADARVVVAQSLAPLDALRRSVNRWFLLVLAGTATAALLLAGWLSARISRPLTALAGKAERLDVERLDVEFATGRRDEIGDLARVLDDMVARLRAGAARLREAERRATVGELARQVNHDIKNGLAPIRNAVRHLAQVARDAPERLAATFREREVGIESSVEYLGALAANYARLTPATERRPLDVSAAVRRACGDAVVPTAVELRARLADGLPPVEADPVALRRILENLISNALESLDADGGCVTVAAEPVDGAVRVTVADTGRGMDEEERRRIFHDFYTTREGGTGLGLSIVRRLVLDLGGRIEVESEPGRGSRFIVELPTGGDGTGDAGRPERPDRTGTPARAETGER